MSSLVSEVADFSLDCLERRDALVPFCKLKTFSGETVYICVEDEEATYEQAATAVREQLRQRISSGDVAEFAIGIDKQVKYSHLPSECRVLEVEFQDGSTNSGIYHFPIEVKDGKARVIGDYYFLDLKEKMI